MSNSNKKNKKMVVLDGIMTYSESESGLLTGDFKNFEPGVAVEPVQGKFKGLLLRDGNFYFEKLPKRLRNKPKFRQDHSSVSRGRNGKGYFVLVVAPEELKAFPQILLKEANEAAAKMNSQEDWGERA